MNSLKYLLLLAIQVLIWNYLDISQFLLLCYLPCLLLCLPTRFSTIAAMIIAFTSGFAVDFFANSTLGVSSAALVLVPLMRRPILTLVFGADVFSRKEVISLGRQGWKKMLVAILLSTSVFLLTYIIIDSAGTRALWVDALKFALSLLASSLVSLYVAYLLTRK